MHFRSGPFKVVCSLRGILLDPPDAPIIGGILLPVPFSPCPTPLYTFPELAFRSQPKPRQRGQVGRDPLRLTHARSGPGKGLCNASTAYRGYPAVVPCAGCDRFLIPQRST